MRTIGVSGVLLLVVYLCLNLETVLSCSCLHQTRQQKFCSSQFSVLAEPFLEIPCGRFKRIYVLQVYEEFKNLKHGNNYAGIIWLQAFTQSSLCGMTLQLNTEYILNGNIVSGTRRISGCGWNERWENVPKPLKTKLLFYRLKCP